MTDLDALLAELPAQRAYRTLGVSGREDTLSAMFLPFGMDKARRVSNVQGKYALLYLLRGSGDYTGPDGERAPLEPGSVLHRFKGDRFTLDRRRDGQWLEFALVLPDIFVEALCALGTLSPGTRVQVPGVSPLLIEQCRRLVRQLGAAPGHELGRVLADAHALLVSLAEASRERARPAPHAVIVRKARRLLEQHPELRFDIPETIAGLGIGYERFRKLFKLHVGYAPKEYRLRQRINAAQRLLGEGNLSVKEVAARLGYPEVAGFSKQFRQYTGVSPSGFRRISG
ncbi:MAG: helix-turn-helix transcriptional regulator [Kiritimatiellae bacterium]|nr:helix-turn-helix transcriptional regulator [Kiritimatiellia bacterium]